MKEQQHKITRSVRPAYIIAGTADMPDKKQKCKCIIVDARKRHMDFRLQNYSIGAISNQHTKKEKKREDFSQRDMNFMDRKDLLVKQPPLKRSIHKELCR